MSTDLPEDGRLRRHQNSSTGPVPYFAPVYAPALGRAPMHALVRLPGLATEPTGPIYGLPPDQQLRPRPHPPTPRNADRRTHRRQRPAPGQHRTPDHPEPGRDLAGELRRAIHRPHRRLRRPARPQLHRHRTLPHRHRRLVPLHHHHARQPPLDRPVRRLAPTTHPLLRHGHHLRPTPDHPDVLPRRPPPTRRPHRASRPGTAAIPPRRPARPRHRRERLGPRLPLRHRPARRTARFIRWRSGRTRPTPGRHRHRPSAPSSARRSCDRNGTTAPTTATSPPSNSPAPSTTAHRSRPARHDRNLAARRRRHQHGHFTRTGTGSSGRYRPRTARPRRIPGSISAPHIAVSLFAAGINDRVVTRAYLTGDASGNTTDPYSPAFPPTAGARCSPTPNPTARPPATDSTSPCRADETVFFLI